MEQQRAWRLMVRVHARRFRPMKAFTLLLAAATVAVLAGCTPARSVQAYCSTLEAHKKEYLQEMSGAAGLSGLVQSVSAIGDLQTMWNDLANVAPDEIRTDTETVRDAWKQTTQDASNQNYLGAVAAALTSSAAASRVNVYIAKNCGSGDAPMGVLAQQPQQSTPATTPAAAPIGSTGPAGSLQLPSDGTWLPLGNNMLTTQVQDGSGSVGDGTRVFLLNGAGDTTLDAKQILNGKDVQSAAFTVAGTATDPLLALVAEVRLPAQGLDPETYVTELDALNWQDLSLIHSTPLQKSTSADDTFTGMDGSDSSVVAVDLSKGGTDHVAGVDARTGSTVWTANGYLKAQSVNTALVINQLSGDPQAPGCYDFTGYDIRTGSAAWTVHNADYQAGGSCVDLTVDVKGGDYSADTPVKSLVTVDQDSGTYPNLHLPLYLDLHTGSRLQIQGEVNQFDPITGDQFRQDNFDGMLSHTSVVNTSNGQTLFSLSDDKVSQLNYGASAIYNGLLYGTTTDGSPVVDATNGTVVANNTSAYPIGPVGASTLWSDGSLTPGTTRTDIYNPAPTPTPTQ